MNATTRAHRSTARLGTVAIAALLLIGTTGCSATVERIGDTVRGGIENGVEDAIESQTGEKTDISVGDATLPDNWPSDVPVPDGEISFSVGTGDSSNIVITLPDQATALALVEQLKTAGYDVIAELMLSENSYQYGLKNDKHTIALLWETSADDGAVTLNYTVTPTAA